jgi:hypothetical protein
MKLRKDPSGAFELLLWDMPAGDIERITKTVLGGGGNAVVIHLGSDCTDSDPGRGHGRNSPPLP